MLLPGVDRLLKVAQAKALIAAGGGRRLLSCPDPFCCAHGFNDTLKDPRGHYLRQQSARIGALAAVPEQLRTKHLLENELASMINIGRQASKLKVGEPEVQELLLKNIERLDRIAAVLHDLSSTPGAVTPPPGGGPTRDQLTSVFNGA